MHSFMMRLNSVLAVLTLIVGAWFAAPSLAQAQTSAESRALQERVQRLEQDLNILQRQIHRGSGPSSVNAPPAYSGGESSAQFGQLSSRVDELENLIRQMNGRMEELENKQRSTAQRVEKLVEDVDFRLAQIERKELQSAAPSPAAQPAAPSAPAAAAQPQQPQANAQAGRDAPISSLEPRSLGSIPAGTGAGNSAQNGAARTAAAAGAGAAGAAGVKLPNGSPKEQYDYATGLLQKGDYDSAQIALAEFVKVNDKDALASSAQYWLGESFFARKQYKEAAQAFLQGYQKYPKGTKAPDSLLKLGLSLNNLRETQQACVVLKKLLTEYPTVEPRIKTAAQREQQQAQCK